MKRVKVKTGRGRCLILSSLYALYVVFRRSAGMLLNKGERSNHEGVYASYAKVIQQAKGK